MDDPKLPSPADAGKAASDPSVPSSKEVQRAVEKLTESGHFSQESMMAMVGTMGGNPLQNKMTTEHISKVLQLGADHDEREYSLSKQQQEYDFRRDHRTHIYHLVYFGILVGLIVTVIFVFKDSPQVLVPILTGIGGVVTGFLAGSGWNKGKRD